MSQYLLDPELTSFDQVRADQNWNWRRLQTEAQYRSLVNGDFRSYLPIEKARHNLTNGLVAVDDVPSITLYNFFRVAIDFKLNLLFQENPIISSPNEQRSRTIEEYDEAIIWQANKAYRDFIPMGRFVMMLRRPRVGSTMLRPQAVDPSAYFPVRDPDDREEVIGHVLAFPIRLKPDNPGVGPAILQPPDAIRIIKFSEEAGVNSTELYQYSPGGRIGALLSDEGPSDILGIATFGEGVESSDFNAAVGPLVKVIINRAVEDQAFTRLAAPPLLLPPGATAPYDPISGTFGEVNARVNDRLQATETGTYGYLDFNAYLGDSRERIREQLSFAYTALKVPPQAFGVDASQRESGLAREELMQSARAEATHNRRQIESIIARLFRWIDGLDVEVNVEWTQEPFSTASQQDTRAVTLLKAGIITPDEARRMSGFKGAAPVQTQPTGGNDGDDPMGRGQGVVR